MALKRTSLRHGQNLAQASHPRGTPGRRSPPHADGDRTLGCVERDSQQARGPVRVDEREIDDGRGLVSRQAEPLTDPTGVSRDLQAADRHIGGGPHRRVNALVLPLDVVGQLWVGHESLDPKLTPLELDAVRPMPTTGDGLPAQSLLSLREIIDADNPAQPATPSLGTSTNGLAERRLVRGGMV